MKINCCIVANFGGKLFFWPHTHKVSVTFIYFCIAYIQGTSGQGTGPKKVFLYTYLFFENLKTQMLAKFMFVKFKENFLLGPSIAHTFGASHWNDN